jgi:hypothetical protein
MKVNSNNRDISFKGLYNSNFLKTGLEFAADKSALFAASTTLALSLTARPISILATPKTDKENKKIAFVKSLISSFTGFGIMLAFSNPLSRGIKQIDKNPSKYLKENTINNLKDGCETLAQSKAYSLATQMFKLGLGLVAAIPKAIITSLSIPPVMNVVFPPAQNNNKEKGNNASLTFRGRNNIAKSVGKVLNNEKFQSFSKEYKNSNFPMHIVAGTDILTTGTFIYQTKKNKNIKEERKNPLCYNAAISTGLSILSSYFVDSITNKPTEKFIQKFKEANKNSPKLDKYIEGIKIAKPILIVGGIYYILIPLLSTFLADRVGNARAKAKNSSSKPLIINS